MLPFIDEKKRKKFENFEYYFIEDKTQIACFKLKFNFQCEYYILKNFHDYLQMFESIKYDNELYIEDGWKIYLNCNFNRHWKVEKNNKFRITYDGNEISINSKNNYINISIYKF